MINGQEQPDEGKPETIKRLKAIAEDLDGGDPARRRRLAKDRPIAGTRLIREYQGIEHHVTVRDEDFRISGTAVQIIIRHRARDHQHALERACIFWPEESAGGIMKKQPVVQKFRCAVYTRKSGEEGLEQEFNSLDAQREACEAYVASQKAEGWLLVPDRYDDGGVSDATLERPAPKRLLADIEAQRVDVVVVYKIDRLSRALTPDGADIRLRTDGLTSLVADLRAVPTERRRVA